MMQNGNASAPRKPFAKRFSRVSAEARRRLHGPRSVTLPQDPDGRTLWLEAIVRLTLNSRQPARAQSLSVFSVPNVIEHDESSPLLIRNTNWDRDHDKELCKRGDLAEPSIVTTYKRVSRDNAKTIDELLRHLDESQVTFEFPVEGLDLAGPSGFKVLPEDAVIVTGVRHYGLYRVTRFCSVELHWTPIQERLTELDDSWNALFDALACIVGLQVGFPSLHVWEIYDSETASGKSVIEIAP